MKNLLFISIAISFLLQACSLSGVQKSGLAKRGHNSSKEVLYSSSDLKMSKKYYITQLALANIGSGSFTGSAYLGSGDSGIEGHLDAVDKETRTHFYKISKTPKSWKSNWAMYNPKSKQLVFFQSDAQAPEQFEVKRSDVGFRLGKSPLTKGMSKGKAVREISATRLRLEAQERERIRIQDSIREANTLQGKDIAGIEIVPLGGGGIGGQLGVGFKVNLKNGRTLKSDNIPGGLTPIGEFEGTSDFGNYSYGKIGLPSSLNEFTAKEANLTIKSKFGGPSQIGKIDISFPTEITVKAQGNDGSSGSSASSGQNGGHGSNGSNGKSVNVTLESTETKGGTSLVKALIYVDGSLQSTNYLSPNATITILANGGAGGSGASGGTGKHAEAKTAGTFYGTPGGNGGNGGSGGNGGNVTISRNGCRSITINANVNGGNAGSGGSGGSGGANKQAQASSNGSSSPSSTRVIGNQPGGSKGQPGSPGAKGSISDR